VTKTFTKEEIEKLIDPAHLTVVNKWLARGDGIAAYENQELGNPDLGHHKFVSFGSKAAQLEVETPPDLMPDIGAINWRYSLIGTYRGAALEPRPARDISVSFKKRRSGKLLWISVKTNSAIEASRLAAALVAERYPGKGYIEYGQTGWNDDPVAPSVPT